jgi:thioester reductase-like protein
MTTQGAGSTVLVTGFPIFVARRLVRELADRGCHVLLLARGKFVERARQFAEETNAAAAAGPKPRGGRVEVLEGDILQLDLGLSGALVRRLHAEVEQIHHLAAVQYLGLEGPKMDRVNIGGLREVLTLALGMRKLRRLCHWSTAFVAGDREGVVHEHELDAEQRFRNGYERSKAAAERLARGAMAKLPITVVRPPIIVGDAETGEVDRFDGPYLLINAIVNAPANATVPLPGRGRYPLHVVPADYAVRAAIALAEHPRALGGTYHLVDPNPLTAKQFFDAIADAAGRPRPQVMLPGGLTRAVLGLPGVRSMARQQRTFAEWFDTDVCFDARHAREMLEPLGLRCPQVPSYVDVLVRYVREFTR